MKFRLLQNKYFTAHPARLLGALAVAACIVLAFSATLVKAVGNDGRTRYRPMGERVNQPQAYPVVVSDKTLKCVVDVNAPLGSIDKRIFGTNLEWFNEAGGLSSQDSQLKSRLAELAKKQGVSVMRYPGGTLADFYHWRDGIGPVTQRQVRKHPTDSGSSANTFGSPEFFRLLHTTGAEGLITVNAGTSSAKEAAEWVAYANQKGHSLRMRDGIIEPADIKLWEIGNELYLPGNPGEQKITVTPEVYAQRYLDFSRAMKAVDPSITTVAIGVAKSHVGPDTQYPEWSKVLLQKAASEIDMIAVHNAYFPMLYTERQPSVQDVYPGLWASPEAVDRSLTTLEALIAQYEGKKKIGIAITEWGALFSLPNVDNYWVDHVKTMGSGVYVARMLQVMMSHPRVQLANYFKLTDRSFMGWINYQGEPKVPYWVFALYANNSGDVRLNASVDSPSYNANAIGIIAAEKNVANVTVLASRDSASGRIYVNLLNRSMTTAYPVNIDLLNASKPLRGKKLSIQSAQMTAHNGRDIPPEWPYKPEYEPYSTASANSIAIKTSEWMTKDAVILPPFSVMTLVLEAAAPASKDPNSQDVNRQDKNR